MSYCRCHVGSYAAEVPGFRFCIQRPDTDLSYRASGYSASFSSGTLKKDVFLTIQLWADLSSCGRTHIPIFTTAVREGSCQPLQKTHLICSSSIAFNMNSNRCFPHRPPSLLLPQARESGGSRIFDSICPVSKLNHVCTVPFAR